MLCKQLNFVLDIEPYKNDRDLGWWIYLAGHLSRQVIAG